MSATQEVPKVREGVSTLLAGSGSHGGWTVDIDETASGEQRWLAQIQGPLLDLTIPIDSPCVVKELIGFLTSSSDGKASCEFPIRKSRDESVSLLRDDEFTDRYFLLVETRNGLVMRCTMSGPALHSLVVALKQVQTDFAESAEPTPQ